MAGIVFLFSTKLYKISDVAFREYFHGMLRPLLAECFQGSAALLFYPARLFFPGFHFFFPCLKICRRCLIFALRPLSHERRLLLHGIQSDK